MANHFSFQVFDIDMRQDEFAFYKTETGFIASNSEARRALKEKSIAVNKEKVEESYIIGEKDIIDNKFVLLQRGKKNYFVIVIV